MNNGLDISEAQFMGMKTKEQNLMLFRNVVHIRKQFISYGVTKKIQYWWLSSLTALTATLFGIKYFFVGT